MSSDTVVVCQDVSSLNTLETDVTDVVVEGALGGDE